MKNIGMRHFRICAKERGIKMKIAIVTGASSGIGREFVYQISRRYPKLDEIWVIARNEEALYKLQEELEIVVRVIPADLSSDEDIRKIALILETYKPDVKLLVNSAGYGIISEFELSSFEAQMGMIDVNCRGLTAMTYLSLPYMKKKSRIIQMASAAAFCPQQKFSVYAASKAYVLSFSKSLNEELKNRGITVTAVCPGPVDTAFFDKAEAESNKTAWYKKMLMVKPEKVVSQALQDAALKKNISVYGLPMKAAKIFTKLMPDSVSMKFFK